MSDIRSFPEGGPAPDEPKLKAVLDVLDAAFKEARRGELSAVVVAAFAGDGTALKVWWSPQDDRVPDLLDHLTALRGDLLAGRE